MKSKKDNTIAHRRHFEMGYEDSFIIIFTVYYKIPTILLVKMRYLRKFYRVPEIHKGPGVKLLTKSSHCRTTVL